ncbi:hypothetical protein H6M51_24160 [Rhizobium sp. AQ_MP]|uniref:hypothetical protein n=1 Tax=Rhizobium sp. AQ_MP TaxID=2761536 RepID=UPI0016394EBC|nr:hypothetical protein [Rhizobium sp. AQ_MP]MBC2775943.1 hypothetical protein [Rhizobium sp. AQ_MP]
MHTPFQKIHPLWTPKTRHPYHVAMDEDEWVLSGPSVEVSISGVIAYEGTHAIGDVLYGILSSKASSPLKAGNAMAATST